MYSNSSSLMEVNIGTKFPTGKPFYIRTVTHILTGVLVEAVPGSHFVLTDAAWIADTGRYSGALATANFSEVEPYPDNRPVWVGWTAMIDACEIESAPRVQK